ncbi:hypothetical protein TraAM80_00304 [Trypanosoma rangeli]|uniref:Uncharacterized protein n=1 Tax=Trypanosoma rangeli TaxID=5698 RepID=A0A3R7P445_TRYRA|nr:uncharacterized protein TraAM80_00304 [Trypanosoma rangeli]RNF12452.1 hypothetical protein TraAM80_00304 [Trypanosoma rangeli]|eukprot:RNF12452.1 hypothetical protein TraAM80_00304 [Trypanosoma rangeli]
MSFNVCTVTCCITLFSCFLLAAFESWLRCDDVFGLNGHEHLGVLRNGDVEVIQAVANGGLFFQRDSSQMHGDGNTSTDACNAPLATDADKNNVMAVIIMGAPSLPEGVIGSTAKARLLHGVRTALLAGALWIITSGGIRERESAEQFLWEMQCPSESLFPDAMLSELPPKLRNLAGHMRDSMSFDTSLKSWIRRGRVLKRQPNPLLGDKAKEEDMSFPRLLRYGAAEWILPGFLWADADDTGGSEETTGAEQAVMLLQRRLLEMHADFLNESRQKRPTERALWPCDGCFNVIVVSSMHNERYARALVHKAMRRDWGLWSSSRGASQWPSSQAKEQEQWASAECVHVLVTSADDAEPTWAVPSPLFVRGPIQSMTNFSPTSSLLARFLGVYAHAIHANYRRWFACMQVSLLSHRTFSLINEVCRVILAHLTETISVRDLAYSAFDKPPGR